MSWTYQSWGAEYPRIAVDLTGNNSADILGFGYDGVWVSLNDGNGNFSAPNIGILDFCIATGWSTDKHPRFLADVTGNGHPDIVGFGDAGVYVGRSNGDGTFLPVEFAFAELAYNQGWRVEKHPRFVLDLNGNGTADIIGFGDDGVWTAMNKGDGTFHAPQYILADFGVNQGWHVERHPRYVVDLDGDGKPDIIGFFDDGVYVAMNKGDGNFHPVKMGLFGLGYNQGWRVNEHVRLVGDVLGVGKASLVAAKENGEILIALGIGNGSFQIPQPAGINLGYLYKYFQSDPSIMFNGYLIFLADIIGDGKKKQLVAFGDSGVFIADLTDPASSPFSGIADFGIDQGWRIEKHPRYVVPLKGDGTPGIVGFGEAGVYTAMSKGDNTFVQPATFALADFGRTSGRVVSSITVDFKMHDDGGLDDETQLHLFIKNRSSDNSDSGDPGSLSQHIQNYADAEEHWYEKNPYLGCALCANVGGGFDEGDTKRVTISLRSKPIPVEELNIPEILIFIVAKGDNTWKFEYTVTITLEDGTHFAFESNVNGITGIILDQDNSNYSGIGNEINNRRPSSPPHGQYKGPLLNRATIEFKTHDEAKSVNTFVNIHIVNRKSNNESQDISVISDIATFENFDKGTDYTFELPIAANNIYLGDIVLPVVYIHIIPHDGDDTWIFDYTVTLYFDNTKPYQWTTSGVILDKDHAKHMGVYSGSRIRVNPQASLTLSPITRHKSISLAYVNRKLNDLLFSRQVAGSIDPLIKIRVDNTNDLISSMGFTFKSNDDYAAPRSYVDKQFIDNAPPPPNRILGPNETMGYDWPHSMSDLGTLVTTWGLRSLVQEQLNDINLQFLYFLIDTNDLQTPLNVEIAFETSGPVEVTGDAFASFDINLVKDLDIKTKLTLRPDFENGVVDLMAWLKDISKIQRVLHIAPGGSAYYVYNGSFLGKPQSGQVNIGDYDGVVQGLIDQVYEFDISEDISEPIIADLVALIIGALASTIGGLFGSLGALAAFSLGTIFSIDKLKGYISDTIRGKAQNGFLGLRDGLNIMASQALMGGVVNGANTGPGSYPNPSRLTGMSVNNGMLTLDYIGPQYNFQFPAPCKADWPGGPLDPGTLANIDHIIVLTMENRSFDHMLGYLSLPYEKGGMNRTDIDGLKGDEYNPYNGRRIKSFRLPYEDTIFSPGPDNGFESTTTAINGGRMNGFVQAHADAYGNTMAHRVMGYHCADNVPTYDALAREFAVCHRWFASFPGETFPNRFFELTGRPNIDAWGMWDYYTDNASQFAFTDTIFDHLSEQGVSWKYFEHSPCQLRLFERHTFDEQHIVNYDDPEFGFENLALSGALPSVSFIDPHFKDFPPGGFCDEPPSDIRNSQRFIEDLVGIVRASPTWEKTLLIITYDEHGGFYDHVAPPAAPQVSPELPKTTGVRLPTFIVSPWVKRGSVIGYDSPGVHPPVNNNEEMRTTVLNPNSGLHFDHTSILKTIVRRFMSQHPPYMGARYAAAHDLSEVLSTEKQENTGPFLPFVPYTLEYENTKMNLDVGNDRSRKALLHKSMANPANIPDWQKFRFEDAGDGLFYIRTFAGLFVTVLVPHLPVHLVTEGGILAHYVVQDLKFPVGSVGYKDPNLQKWRLVPGSNMNATAFNTNFVVYSAAFPNLVLQPVDPSPGATLLDVIVGIPTPSTNRLRKPNEWNITSPLIPNNIVLNS
jgi:phospholipase C